MSADNLLQPLIEMKDCTYQNINYSEFMAEISKEEELEQYSIYEYLRSFGLPWRHYKDTKIIKVSIGPSGTLPTALGVFHIPFMRSYFLIRDAPDDLSPLERFKLLHEIGHSLGTEFASQSSLMKMVQGVLAGFLLVLPLIQWNAKSFALASLVGVAIAIQYRTLLQQKKISRLENELKADAYSLALMKEHDKEDLQTYPAEAVLTKDEELTNIEHLYRIAEFEKRLHQSETSLFHFDFPLSTTQFALSLSLGGINLLAWLLLLGTFLRPLNNHFVPYAYGILIFLFVLIILRYLNYSRFGFTIDFIFSGTLAWKEGSFQLKGKR
jgi:hypothetical protein